MGKQKAPKYSKFQMQEINQTAQAISDATGGDETAAAVATEIKRECAAGIFRPPSEVETGGAPVLLPRVYWQEVLDGLTKHQGRDRIVLKDNANSNDMASILDMLFGGDEDADDLDN